MDDESGGELIVGEIHTIICNVLPPLKRALKEFLDCKEAFLHLYCWLDPLIMLPKPMDHMHHSHHDNTTNA